MGTLEEHCQDCMNELGDEFRHVHEFLDELQAEYGPLHRAFRHHTEGVEMIRSRWGDAAAEAAEIHVRRDTGGKIPTPKELREYYGVNTEDIAPEED